MRLTIIDLFNECREACLSSWRRRSQTCDSSTWCSISISPVKRRSSISKMNPHKARRSSESVSINSRRSREILGDTRKNQLIHELLTHFLPFLLFPIMNYKSKRIQVISWIFCILNWWTLFIFIILGFYRFRYRTKLVHPAFSFLTKDTEIEMKIDVQGNLFLLSRE